MNEPKIHHNGKTFGKINSFLPIPVKVFRPPSKPLYCVRQCNGRYHSATGTVRTSLCLPLH